MKELTQEQKAIEASILSFLKRKGHPVRYDTVTGWVMQECGVTSDRVKERYFPLLESHAVKPLIFDGKIELGDGVDNDWV